MKTLQNKTLKKVYFLLYDLILKETDESVGEFHSQKNFIKEYLLKNNNKVIVRMLTTLNYEDKKGLFSDHVLREFILHCLGSVFQYNNEAISAEIEDYLSKQSYLINEEIRHIKDNNGDEDTASLLSSENEMISKILLNNGDS